MIQLKRRQIIDPKTERQPRIFSPGREFTSAKAFADFTRAAEVARINSRLF